jgi:Septum formation
MSSQPTGDAQRPAVSADQAGEAEAAQPEAAAGEAAAAAETAATAETAEATGGAEAVTPAVPDGASPPAGDKGAPAYPAANAATASAAGAEATVADGRPATMVLDPDTGPRDPETGLRDSETGLRDPETELRDFETGLDEPETEISLEPEPVSKLAVVALVTGVLALVPVAVACGIAALAGIRRTGRRGHGMALAALFVSAAWVIAAGAVGTVGALTHGFRKPVTIKYHQSAVFTLQQGDCVTMSSGQAVSVLPCSTPHQAEVFATFSLARAAWPGAAAVKQEASSGCESRLTSYLNPQLAISLTQAYVFPDEVAWTGGTRTVICEVRAASGDLTGSVRGGSA